MDPANSSLLGYTVSALLAPVLAKTNYFHSLARTGRLTLFLEEQDRGLENRTLFWKNRTLFWETGSWIENHDAVLENRTMDWKPTLNKMNTIALRMKPV